MSYTVAVTVLSAPLTMVYCTGDHAVSTSRPTGGTTDGEFVVTVNAQYDIRPHGRT